MPEISEKRIFEMVGSFYDVAHEPSREGWQKVYLEIADVLSSGPGGLFLSTEKFDRIDLAVGTCPPDALQEYTEHYQFVSPFRDTIMNMRVGEGFVRSAAMSDQALFETEFYNDYLRKSDIFNYVYYPLIKSNGITAGLTFSRPESRPDFSTDERLAIAVMLPHLARAFKVNLSFSDVHIENQAVIAALAAMTHGVIVIDKYRKIKYANQKAETLIGKNDGLIVDRRGSLRASRNGDDRILSELLKGIFSPAIDNLAYHGGAHRIMRSDGTRSLQILVSPFSAHIFLGANSETMAMIFVHDRNERIDTHERVLVQLYGLTAAEARLAAVLSDGKSLDEACEILKIARSTCRTHLNRIFLKTGTNRQSELALLIVNGIANLRIGK